MMSVVKVNRALHPLVVCRQSKSSGGSASGDAKEPSNSAKKKSHAYTVTVTRIMFCKIFFFVWKTFY
jgi:hypothetical protein